MDSGDIISFYADVKPKLCIFQAVVKYANRWFNVVYVASSIRLFTYTACDVRLYCLKCGRPAEIAAVAAAA